MSKEFAKNAMLKAFVVLQFVLGSFGFLMRQNNDPYPWELGNSSFPAAFPKIVPYFLIFSWF